MFRFSENGKKIGNFEKKCFTFPNFQKFQKIQNMRRQFDNHFQSACFVGNQLVLSWKLYSWRQFPRTLIFYRHRENMTSLWRCLRPTFQSLGKILRSVCIKFMPGGVCKVWWWYLISFFSYGKKNGGGPFRPPPPSGRGLRCCHNIVMKRYSSRIGGGTGGTGAPCPPWIGKGEHE